MKFSHLKNDLIHVSALSIATSFISFAISIISTYLLSHTNTVDKHDVLLVALFIFVISSSVLNYISEMALKSLNINVLTTKMPLIWQHVMSLPLSATTKIPSAELCKMISDYEMALASITSNIYTVLSGVLVLFLLLGYMFYCHALLALLYLTACLILFSVKIFTYPLFSRQMNNHLAAQASSDAFLNEALCQIHKIKTANIESNIHKKWLTLLFKSKEILMSAVTIENTIWCIETSSLAVLSLITLYSHISISFLLCAGQLILYYDKLSSDLLALVNLKIALNRLAPILNADTEPHRQSHCSNSFKGELQLLAVSFNKLENITMHITAGSFIALTGATGAGKSTIFKLILGLEPAYTGTILLDNQNIKDLNMQDVRKHFGVVLQTSSLFAGTIFSNISTNVNITLDEAWQLARLVGLDEEVNAMPMKMFTYISDNPGDSISGGQRQKILIARALASKPKILFLDEATSALDSASQSFIFNNLQLLNITRVVIAHRLSTIAKADKIYHLEHGHVIIVNKK